MDDRSRGNCSSYAQDQFDKLMREQIQQMMRVNGLIVANAILAGILVGVGAYGPRYRHRAFIRSLFQGATTLFLPIVSYVVSNGATIDSTFGGRRSHSIQSGPTNETLLYRCRASSHMVLVLLWAGLVQIVGINTCAIVAADDREGRRTGLPVVLLVQAIWTSYLVANNIQGAYRISLFLRGLTFDQYSGFNLRFYSLLSGVYPLIFARLVFKYYAFHKARRSFAFGHNPRLIVGYMDQLQEECRHVGPTDEHLPPPLIVMGEERQQVEKQPHGYCFKRMSNQDNRTMMNDNGLVTIDKVWQLDDMLLTSIPQPKDVCLSFALFKMLHCRFAGYTVAEAGFMKAHNFFWHALLKDDDHERVLGVITDELSFLHDYYYSALPISYSKCWLPVFSILSSLLTISYCLLAGVIVAGVIVGWWMSDSWDFGQIECALWCSEVVPAYFRYYGNLNFDLVPVILLLTLVVLAEVKDIASYICSNWTKVALICRYILNHDTWQRSPSVQKWVGRVLRCRCKLMKYWDDKMNQCSVLVLHPRKPPIVLLTRLLRLPDQKKNVKVPTVVKAAIIDALISNNGLLSNGATNLRRSLQDGADNFLWACNGKGSADIILMWHIATSILEVRHQHTPLSDHKIIATHLSRYCTYLVACLPELLPDDDPWCKSLYKAVKKDAMRVLAGGIGVSMPKAEYQQLVELLRARSKHEVLKNGAGLGKQLAELVEGEETAWKVLAGFWTEMILYVAPSDNLNGHAEAIARGGELITLLWALLAHVGIVSRPDATAAATAGDPVAV